MTEAEWLVSADPQEMVWFLKGKASDRKLRLMACGCCRSVWAELENKRSSRAVEVAELCADGEVTRKEMVRAGETARSAMRSAWKAGRRRPEAFLHGAARDAALSDAYHAAICASDAICRAYEGTLDYKPSHARLLSDIFGNPFKPVALDPDWLIPTVVKLAEAIYGDRAFDVLPILADALEEAGCDNGDILTHCRSEGPHVRGCWVVDLTLGKK